MKPSKFHRSSMAVRPTERRALGVWLGLVALLLAGSPAGATELTDLAPTPNSITKFVDVPVTNSNPNYNNEPGGTLFFRIGPSFNGSLTNTGTLTNAGAVIADGIFVNEPGGSITNKGGVLDLFTPPRPWQC